MSLDTLERFLFWALIINVTIYCLIAFCSVVLRSFICRMQSRMFELSEDTIKHALYAYIASYKLLITVFVLAPWLATLMMK